MQNKIKKQKQIEKNNDKISYNEIKIIIRTIENNTHEVLSDTKIKKITSWRKSKKKFLNSLKYNIFSFGILHLVSLYYPNLYIKLYCNPWPAKECDYFLIENIYGKFTLCEKIHKKFNNNIKYRNTNSTKQNIPFSSNTTNSKLINHRFNTNLTYSFIYKSNKYEYLEETNEIIPVYMNFSKITNKEIFTIFSEGLSTEDKVNKYTEIYGKNEYHIDLKLPIIYFKINEIPSFILVFLSGIIEFIVLKDFISFLFKTLSIIIIFLIQFLNIKKILLNQYKKDFTLDGDKNKIKVKRKYLLRENSQFYKEINNLDLVPGDVIYLKINDFVPCDCILLEGECIVNESNLTGNLDTFKKTSLENNNELFNYRDNNINILYHGMKIIKSFSKLNKVGYISALCINTGPNTYKANQYSNILYYLEKKKENSDNSKKLIIIYMIIVFFLSILLSSFYFFQLKLQLKNANHTISFYKMIILIFCKSLMPVYFITFNIMVFVNVYRLQKENIICFDKSILINSGKINTIFLNKTKILSQDSLLINNYNPCCFDINKPCYSSFKTFSRNQCKEMNLKLLEYYREYLNLKQNNSNNFDFDSQPFKLNNNNNKLLNKFNNKSNEFIALFLECLLSCNHIEKFNIEIFGNDIETAIFNDMKWDIKMKDFTYKDNEYINSYLKELNTYKNSVNFNKSNYRKVDLVENKIFDIFPKN